MRRRRIVAALLTLFVLGGAAFLVLFIGGRAGLGPASSETPGSNRGATEGPGAPASPPPSVCPLSGLDAEEGAVPDRPALAVKVENLPAARPQTGMSWADIVYEEPVEANITRFIAVYQCRDASRIEPVRSARLTDPDILVQFGHPLFAYAGGVPEVRDAIAKAGLVDVDYNRASQAYERDPAREAPHNLFTSTTDLYAAAAARDGIPAPLFRYTDKKPRGTPATEVHVPFSVYSDVYWRYDGSTGEYLRWHGDVQHVYSDDTPVSATNVIVQMVDVVMTDITDVNGVPSPEVISTGSGKAYVFRGGKVVVGRWKRPRLQDVTKFVDDKGKRIKLIPGQTWVELVPLDTPVSYS